VLLARRDRIGEKIYAAVRIGVDVETLRAHGGLKFERESVSKNYKEAWKKIDAAEADMDELEAKIKKLQSAEPSKDNY
jgi:hypothetical protein